MNARRLPGIRKPDHGETPLSEAEQWVAVRESHWLALWLDAQPRHVPDQAEAMSECGPRGEAWL